MHHVILEQLGLGELRASFQFFNYEGDKELFQRLGTPGDRLHTAFAKQLQEQVPGSAFAFPDETECTVTYPAEVYVGEVASAFARTLNDFVGQLHEMEEEEDRRLNFPNFVQKLTFNSGDPFQQTLFNLDRFTKEQVDYLRAQLEKRA